MTHAFMQLHHALHWWGPGVLAACFFLIPWIAHWPLRNQYGYEDAMEALFWTTVAAFVVFYVLWFAFPYPGTALLLMIIVAPFALIATVWPAFGYVAALIELHSDWVHDRNKAKGKFYWKNHKDFEEERQARLPETQEKADMIRAQQGEHPGNHRFDVIDGGNKS